MRAALSRHKASTRLRAPPPQPRAGVRSSISRSWTSAAGPSSSRAASSSRPAGRRRWRRWRWGGRPRTGRTARFEPSRRTPAGSPAPRRPRLRRRHQQRGARHPGPPPPGRVPVRHLRRALHPRCPARPSALAVRRVSSPETCALPFSIGARPRASSSRSDGWSRSTTHPPAEWFWLHPHCRPVLHGGASCRLRPRTTRPLRQRVTTAGAERRIRAPGSADRLIWILIS